MKTPEAVAAAITSLRDSLTQDVAFQKKLITEAEEVQKGRRERLALLEIELADVEAWIAKNA